MGAAHRQAGAVAEDGPKPSFLSREEPERAGKKVGEAVARSRPTAARRAMKRGQWEAFVTTRRITLGRIGTSSCALPCSRPRDPHACLSCPSSEEHTSELQSLMR